MKSLLVAIHLLFGSFAYAHGGHDHNTPMSHLTFANGAIHAHATWEVGPQVSDESTLSIEWKNGSDHSPTEPTGAFEVVLWMPSMGHGSAPTQLERVLDSNGQVLVGVYRVTNIYFVMGGDWQVNVTLTNEDGSKETQAINVNLPDGGGHH